MELVEGIEWGRRQLAQAAKRRRIGEKEDEETKGRQKDCIVRDLHDFREQKRRKGAMPQRSVGSRSGSGRPRGMEGGKEGEATRMRACWCQRRCGWLYGIVESGLGSIYPATCASVYRLILVPDCALCVPSVYLSDLPFPRGMLWSSFSLSPPFFPPLVIVVILPNGGFAEPKVLRRSALCSLGLHHRKSPQLASEPFTALAAIERQGGQSFKSVAGTSNRARQ